MLELMARAGMRVGEVLKLTPKDIEDRKLIIRDPKSGKELEMVFIPLKVADRLKMYINAKGTEPDQRIFPITYPAARAVVIKAGKLVGINLRPMHLDPGLLLNSSRKSSSDTQILLQHKGILGRLLIWRH